MQDNVYETLEEKWLERDGLKVKVLNPKATDPTTYVLHLKNFFNLEEINRYIIQNTMYLFI